MLRRFRLEEPESVAEAAELLGRFGESAKVYAGGTELLLAMKEGLVQYERLINVKKLTGLSDVTSADGALVIGALCTHHQLENSPVLKDKLPALTQARTKCRQCASAPGGHDRRQSLLCRTSCRSGNAAHCARRKNDRREIVFKARDHCGGFFCRRLRNGAAGGRSADEDSAFPFPRPTRAAPI